MLLSEANKEAGGLLAGDKQAWGQCGYYNESNHPGRMGEGRRIGPGRMGRMGQGHMGQGHMNSFAGQEDSCWRY